MSYSRIAVKPVAGALGAEIEGVDLAKPMDDATFAEIKRAHLEYLVIFFRGQDITDEQLAAFGRRFGELAPLPPHRQFPGKFPELLVIDKKPGDKLVFGWEWHSDTTHLEIPSLGSVLYAKLIPPVGGDTMFANQYMAYDTLSDGMKKLIADLHGIHLSGTRKINKQDAGEARRAEVMKLNPPIAQPVVRVHPETGRKALYLGEKVKRFDGMTEEESKPLIDYLNRHATRPECVYRHQWRQHDILVWDNRCTMHQALGDFDETQLRHMERTTVMGTPSGYVVTNA